MKVLQALKIPFLIGIVWIAMMFDFRLMEEANLLLFVMAICIPITMIGLTIWILKVQPQAKIQEFKEENPESWYEQ